MARASRATCALARTPLAPAPIAVDCSKLACNHEIDSQSVPTWTRRRLALPHVLVVVGGAAGESIARRDTLTHIKVVRAGVMLTWTGGAAVC